MRLAGTVSARAARAPATAGAHPFARAPLLLPPHHAQVLWPVETPSNQQSGAASAATRPTGAAAKPPCAAAPRAARAPKRTFTGPPCKTTSLEACHMCIPAPSVSQPELRYRSQPDSRHETQSPTALGMPQRWRAHPASCNTTALVACAYPRRLSVAINCHLSEPSTIM